VLGFGLACEGNPEANALGADAAATQDASATGPLEDAYGGDVTKQDSTGAEPLPDVAGAEAGAFPYPLPLALDVFVGEPVTAVSQAYDWDNKHFQVWLWGTEDGASPTLQGVISHFGPLGGTQVGYGEAPRRQVVNVTWAPGAESADGALVIDSGGLWLADECTSISLKSAVFRFAVPSNAPADSLLNGTLRGIASGDYGDYGSESAPVTLTATLKPVAASQSAITASVRPWSGPFALLQAYVPMKTSQLQDHLILKVDGQQKVAQLEPLKVVGATDGFPAVPIIDDLENHWLVKSDAIVGPGASVQLRVEGAVDGFGNPVADLFAETNAPKGPFELVAGVHPLDEPLEQWSKQVYPPKIFFVDGWGPIAPEVGTKLVSVPGGSGGSALTFAVAPEWAPGKAAGALRVRLALGLREASGETFHARVTVVQRGTLGYSKQSTILSGSACAESVEVDGENWLVCPPRDIDIDLSVFAGGPGYVHIKVGPPDPGGLTYCYAGYDNVAESVLLIDGLEALP
jgi:hypothetical protein